MTEPTQPFAIPPVTPPHGFAIIPPPSVPDEANWPEQSPQEPRRRGGLAIVIAIAALVIAAGALLLVHTSHLSPGPAGPAGKTGARGPAGHVHGITVCIQHDPATGNVTGIGPSYHGNCPGGGGTPVYLP